MSKMILGYWDVRGLGQPIRFLLKYLKIDFEERRYIHGRQGPDFNREDWMNEKFTLGLDFPNIPYLIDGEFKITDSRAILRYIARKYGGDLLPKDPVELAKVEMLEGAIMDMWDFLAEACYEYTEALLKKLEEVQPQKLKILSEFLGDGKWALGDQLTYVDFLVYETLMTHVAYDEKLLTPLPNLTRFIETFQSLPAIRDYINAKDFIASPYFTPIATHFI